MVSKKRLDYGSNGFQVPFIPRAPRSVRRRVPFKKEVEDGQAFELLASLAGKLLQEGESSASSNASEGNHQPGFGQGVDEQERHDKVKPLVAEGIHKGSCEESIFMTEATSQNSSQKCLVQADTDIVLERTSVSNDLDCWDKVEADVKPEICKWENKFGHCSDMLAMAAEDFRELGDGNIKNAFRQQDAGSSSIEGSTVANKCSLKDPLEMHVNSNATVGSKRNVKSPFCRESFPDASFSKHGNNIKLGFRDDDENFLRCNKVSTKSKAFKPPQRIAHRRIRKLLTSKYWKSSPKLKDYELSRSGKRAYKLCAMHIMYMSGVDIFTENSIEFADVGVKSFYHKRKTCYSFGRCRHDTFSKRRKFLNRGSVVTSDGGFSSDSVSNSPAKGMVGDNPNSSGKLHVSKDSHVKFSIKSFKIPELYIEVPETATVGSLKRTVMEAVMAILGGGLHVGVLLKGKKVRDDNRTLQQTGISCEENLDTLGFTLEPSSLKASPAVCVGDPPSQCETSQPTRSPVTPILDSATNEALLDSSLLTNTGNLLESNHNSNSSHIDIIAKEITSDSRALVPVPDRDLEALAVVPVSQKARRSELVQRRTRRPFSVSEVEALVQAVEELGTGRWRDVKLRAFENADHRTYVDLKDKWKTLVHTARISPQQRRGEPVPQELLDRVLAAHAYWSQHQIEAKQQHAKPQASTPKIPEAASADRQCVEEIQIQPLVMM